MDPVNLFPVDYREGSLTVVIKMTFDAMVSDEQARALLEEAVSSGWLGRFEVNETSVKSIASKRNEVKPPGKGKLSALVSVLLFSRWYEWSGSFLHIHGGVQ